MTQPTVFWCGQFLPRDQARMDVEDRGVLFGDGVYEVTRYYRGVPLGMSQHLDRLRHSLALVRMPEPADVAKLDAISEELVRRNGCPDAKVYWQITRGYAGPRDHVMPDRPTPTLLVIASPAPALEQLSAMKPARAILAPDIRWGLCSAKTLMLLPAVMAKTQAHQQGADEAIFHRDGTVTEASATNVMIVRKGELWTHPADHAILRGVTRDLALSLAQGLGIAVRQQPFNVQELLAADEVILTGTTTHVRGVVEVDGHAVADGKPGPIATRLLDAMVKHIADLCGA